MLALLLQATALLVHFGARPHTHHLALLTADDASLPTAHSHDHSVSGHASDHHKVPAQNLPDCPAWTTLHLLGGCTPPTAAAFFEEPWPVAQAFHPISVPAPIRWVGTGAQPRAPPVTG